MIIRENDLTNLQSVKRGILKKIKNTPFYSFVFGDIYSHKIEAIVEFIIKGDEKSLQSIIGDFFLIVYDSIEQNVFIFTDRGGQTIAFYSIENGITISDNLWNIAQELKLDSNSLNIQAFKEQILFNTSLDNSTFLNGVFLTTPASIIKYNLIDKKISNTRYWKFSFNKNEIIKTTSQKIELFDYELDMAFKKIFSVNQKSAKYGVAISGGLDSRIIPFYARKNNVNLEAFIIGESKPHKFFYSHDHSKALEIARHYNLELKFIEYNSINLFEQMKIDVDKFPYYSSDLFKTIDNDKLNFDVLLTGASGYWIGGGKLFSSEINNNEFLYHFYKYLSNSKENRSFTKIKKALNFLLHRKLNTEPKILKQGIPELMTNIEMENSVVKIMKFVDGLGDNTNFELFMNLEHFTIGHRNKNGSYESINGRKKSFSIYSPFLIDFVQSLDENDLIDRQLFESFVMKKFPNLANIGGQKFTPKISRKRDANLFDRTISLSSFVLRGNGCTDYLRWSKKKKNKEQISIMLNSHSKFFDSLFNKSSFQKMIKTKRYDYYLMLNFLKASAIINKLENL